MSPVLRFKRFHPEGRSLVSKLYLETGKTANCYNWEKIRQLSTLQPSYMIITTYTLGVWNGLSSSWGGDEVPMKLINTLLMVNIQWVDLLTLG